MSKQQVAHNLEHYSVWPLDRIKDQASKIGSGVTPTGGAATYLDSGVPLLRSQNIHFDGIRLDDVAFVSQDTHADMGGSQLRPGDVLLNITGASIGRCAIVPVGFGEGNVNQHVCIIRPTAKLHPAFLQYCLSSPWGQSQVFSLFTGASRQGLGQRDLGAILIPLPPVEEQRRIAKTLAIDCAAIDEAIAAKRQQLDALNRLLQSTYFATVTRGLTPASHSWDPGHILIKSLPAGWKFVAMKRIVSTKITDGPHETPDLVADGVQFISAEAIKNNRVDFSRRRGYITPELHAEYSRKCRPRRNDIFIIKSGATTGNVACVEVDFEFSIWSPLALLRCDERVAHHRFIFYVLLTDLFRKQVELSWSFGTQQNIGMRVIERLKVPIPPLAEQHAIAQFLDVETAKVEQIQIGIRAQIDTLVAYRNSLIHEYVTGQRRVRAEEIEKKAVAYG